MLHKARQFLFPSLAPPLHTNTRGELGHQAAISTYHTGYTVISVPLGYTIGKKPRPGLSVGTPTRPPPVKTEWNGNGRFASQYKALNVSI